jgi:hypothetical protein
MAYVNPRTSLLYIYMTSSLYQAFYPYCFLMTLLFLLLVLISDLIKFVNEELFKITTYFKLNKLALHPQKTQFMLISNSPSAINYPIKLFINHDSSTQSPDQNLIYPFCRVLSSSSVPAVNFLGIFFDNELNFRYHINQICSKISRALFMLRRCKNFLSAQSLKILYYSLIHCHLIYGIKIWSCSSLTTTNVLFNSIPGG